MAWEILNVSLAVSADTIACEGGSARATITVSGRTDGEDESNRFTASLRDDYVFPDILWKSEPRTVGANADVHESFAVDVRCDHKGHVVGPHGSSGERTAELYAHVDGGELSNSSDESPVRCLKHE